MTKRSAPHRPLPPCGGGTGWGVFQNLGNVGAPPTPNPYPPGGGGSGVLACRELLSSLSPVWSVSFHPSGSDTATRTGLEATGVRPFGLTPRAAIFPLGAA